VCVSHHCAQARGCVECGQGGLRGNGAQAARAISSTATVHPGGALAATWYHDAVHAHAQLQMVCMLRLRLPKTWPRLRDRSHSLVRPAHTHNPQNSKSCFSAHKLLIFHVFCCFPPLWRFLPSYFQDGRGVYKPQAAIKSSRVLPGSGQHLIEVRGTPFAYSLRGGPRVGIIFVYLSLSISNVASLCTSKL